MTLEEKLEQIRELRPIDDIFFQVLASNPRVCEEMLRVILEDKELTVLEVIPQSSEANLLGRSVRLDALCTLGNGKLVNIEVQRADNDDHFRRVRYYASLITAAETDPGTRFADIPDLYIVYITEHDFIKEKKTTYHLDHVLRETGTVIHNGLEVIFVNTEILDGTEIAELMQCFMQKTVENPKFPAFSNEVRQLKETEGGKHTMSDVLLNIMERERAEARAEGLAEGRAAGLAEGRAEIRDSMTEALRSLGFPEAAIQEALRRSCEQERLAN